MRPIALNVFIDGLLDISLLERLVGVRRDPSEVIEVKRQERPNHRQDQRWNSPIQTPSPILQR